jgi:rfaE bifunctional protein kinase chain/domain
VDALSDSFAPERILSCLPRLEGSEVLILGDVMLDQYLLGDAGRISPEAPVPVVLIEEERFMLGGAGNVARNVSALGGRPKLVSACGDGQHSEKFFRILSREGIKADIITLQGRPVATKTRVMARGQQLLRIDREDCSPMEEEDSRRVLEKIEASWPEQGGVLVISDYNKGVVNKTVLEGIHKIRRRYGQKKVQILVDPKTRNVPLYRRVDLLTPNTQETGEAAGLPVRSKEEIIAAGQAIFRKIRCRRLLTTLGPGGMALFQSPQYILHLPTTAREVFDVSGAGDTVIAALALGLASGLDMTEACIIANFAAGNVVAEVGAATTSVLKIAEAIAGVRTIPLERWL